MNVIDEANRGALGIDVAVSIPAVRVIAFLTQMIDLHGRPGAIRCDNGSELTSQAFDALDEVREITADWLERYNQIRPHHALGSLPPARYRERLLAAETPV